MNDSIPRLTSQALTDMPILQECSAEELASLASLARLQLLRKGDILFRVGDQAKDTLHIIVRGQVDVLPEQGKSYQLYEGGFVGLASYLDGTPHTATVTAPAPTEILTIPVPEFRHIEAFSPTLFNALNREIAQRIRNRGGVRQPSSRALEAPARSLMNSPLTFCRHTTPLREAFDLMNSRRIGSLAVLDGKDALIGLLTYLNISDALVHGQAAPNDNVMKVACEDPPAASADAPLWLVEDMAQNRRVKYVVICEHDRPAGIISQTDLLNYLVAQQGLLLSEIAATNTFAQLASYRERISDIAKDALDHNRNASAAVRTVSEFHLALQRRCIELVLDRMEKKGLGPPPAPYAMIIMGSGSRSEMMLNPDQDNGIILGDSPALENADARKWFETFAQRVNQRLDDIGYELCPGDIMANNERYHKTLAQWKAQISHIAKQPSPKAARWANVMFDFKTLYGDDELTAELRQHVFQELRATHRLLTMMVADDAQGKPPLGLFNRLITQPAESPNDDNKSKEKARKGKGKIDIKRNGLRIVANAARIYALKHSVQHSNTADRLVALARQGVLNLDFAKSTTVAYDELLELLLDHQLRQFQAKKRLDKLIDPTRLTPLRHESLRMAMLAVKRFQEKLQSDFDVNPL